MTIDERTSGGVTVLDLRGRMTIESVSDMVVAETVRRQLDHGHTQIVLNMESVPYVDTTGLCNIVEAYVTATKRGGLVKLLQPVGHVREVLNVTRLSTVLRVYDSEAEAIASLKTPGTA